jgi:hypothetical protein
MSLPAGKKLKIIQFADITGGLNINDPALAIKESECADILNAIILSKGWKRWPGCENLTAKGACTNYLRGLMNHSDISGNQYLYVAFGQKLYSISKSTGDLTELYTFTGDGECVGTSAHGTFFIANGTDVVKVEGTAAYRVGIVAPAGVTATGSNTGGSLPNGVYQIYASYARRVSSADVLYSKGQLIESVTISGGNVGKITIADFANSADAQVGNKIIWMTLAGGTDWYLYKSTGNNTTTTFEITSATAENSALLYSAEAAYNDLPGAFDYILAFDNRLWGTIGNILYYSQKGATVYNLEEWPANNNISYPYHITGLFGSGTHLCLNTYENGVIVQPNADVSAKFEHYEQKTSFKYMNTVADWNGNKIGLTFDRVGVFSGSSFTFEPWDYGYNIRPALSKIWTNTEANFSPCGLINRRDNRNEYLLSFQDTTINETNNNRTYVLNLSRTMFQDIDNYRTPWEVVGRGFNYACVDASGQMFMGQSFNGSSTVYKELTTNSTEKGIYGDDGVYKDTAANMAITVLSKSFSENMFTKTILENIRAMFKTVEVSTILLSIVDDPNREITQQTDQAAIGQELWDVMLWDTDKWSSEGFIQYEFKGKDGINGYAWNFKFSQEADDITMQILQFDVLLTLETGHGI